MRAVAICAGINLFRDVRMPGRARLFTALWSVPLVDRCGLGPATFAVAGSARPGPSPLQEVVFGVQLDAYLTAHRANIMSSGFDLWA